MKRGDGGKNLREDLDDLMDEMLLGVVEVALGRRRVAEIDWLLEEVRKQSPELVEATVDDATLVAVQ